ncbi:uncharacterized protein G6M90_00g021010 [Metarhizium brunneum]|uniref:Uncharacterized protein n=1 Tax=Metarhizium brunneum TaxID=500148 RepID=A0A7D5UTQ7_9HYPO
MAFEWASWLENNHIIVHAADLQLNPPQSYLFVQDFLIILCALLYCFCYVFYTLRTKRDRFLAGPVDLLFGNLAYELYYPFVMARGKLELVGCLVWLLLDVRFVYTAIKYTCPPGTRIKVTLRCALSTLALTAVYYVLGLYFPDDGEQVTAYWTGWLLELGIGWCEVLYLWKHAHTKGQSLEIWVVRFCGVLSAMAVFFWRYLNVPQNWAYVVSWPSIILVGLNVVPELMYPFLYRRAERKMREAAVQKEKTY